MIEPNGGFFVGLDESDLAYRDRFVRGCQDCHIPIEEVKTGDSIENGAAVNQLGIHTVFFGSGWHLRSFKTGACFCGYCKII
ncbi:MAG: hypothetical protein MZV70_46405 [Desulfobacterales bacterium]|nr:hypothetical protein [Desulfobacterales bacterium]